VYTTLRRVFHHDSYSSARSPGSTQQYRGVFQSFVEPCNTTEIIHNCTPRCGASSTITPCNTTELIHNCTPRCGASSTTTHTAAPGHLAVHSSVQQSLNCALQRNSYTRLYAACARLIQQRQVTWRHNQQDSKVCRCVVGSSAARACADHAACSGLQHHPRLIQQRQVTWQQTAVHSSVQQSLNCALQCNSYTRLYAACARLIQERQVTWRQKQQHSKVCRCIVGRSAT
jgi:hypothetical protein